MGTLMPVLNPWERITMHELRKKTPLIEHTKFLYETIPAVTWCNACKSTYPTIQYGKTCPHCGSGETWLQQGNEMNIKQIVAC